MDASLIHMRGSDQKLPGIRNFKETTTFDRFGFRTKTGMNVQAPSTLPNSRGNSSCEMKLDLRRKLVAKRFVVMMFRDFKKPDILSGKKCPQ